MLLAAIHLCLNHTFGNHMSALKMCCWQPHTCICTLKYIVDNHILEAVHSTSLLPTMYLCTECAFCDHTFANNIAVLRICFIPYYTAEYRCATITITVPTMCLCNHGDMHSMSLLQPYICTYNVCLVTI